MSKKCKECVFYEDCNEESKVIQMEELDEKLTDPIDALFPIEEEEMINEEVPSKNPLLAESLVPESVPVPPIVPNQEVPLMVSESSGTPPSPLAVANADEHVIP